MNRLHKILATLLTGDYHQYGKPSWNVINLHGIKTEKLELSVNPKTNEKQVVLQGVSWKSATLGKCRIFEHDKKKDYYIVAYPLQILIPSFDIPTVTTPERIVFEKVSKGMYTNDLYKLALLYRYHLSTLLHQNQNNLPLGNMTFHGTVEDVDDGNLYGPITIDEVMNHVQTRFAFLE